MTICPASTAELVCCLQSPGQHQSSAQQPQTHSPSQSAEVLAEFGSAVDSLLSEISSSMVLVVPTDWAHVPQVTHPHN